mgnify:CR=1 FL=1
MFEVAWLISRSNNYRYSIQMRDSCARYGLKPVCDHPSYCRNDKNSIYLGQQHHISYPPHRNSKNYNPVGWELIKDKFAGLCVYSNNAASKRGLCNIPINTHSWRTPGQANPGFMCGSEVVKSFVGQLGGRKGVASRKYVFQIVKLIKGESGKYADQMIAHCARSGMKPVCDPPSYCKSDRSALYIGQHSHIAYGPHRRINSYFPSGWSAIAKQWNGLCSYTGRGRGNYALCNVPANSHSWQLPSKGLGFVCGKAGGSTKAPTTRAPSGSTKAPTTRAPTSTKSGATFTSKLGAMNGVRAATYTFRKRVA